MLALNNLQNGISVNIDMLLGEGQYITVAAQTKMDTQAFTQASKAAHNACLCLPHLPVPQESFPALRQGANEPYMSFVDKLQNAQSVQCSHSFTSDSVTPQTTACQASLSITNSWSLLKLMSIELVMPFNHLILCRPCLLLPSIFPCMRIFSEESSVCIKMLLTDKLKTGGLEDINTAINPFECKVPKNNKEK